MYIKRHIESAVKERAQEKGAIVITGARQVGKTTLVENVVPMIEQITLDDLDTQNRAMEEPSAFIQLNPPPIFIDEVQYAPNIFPYIKINLDNSKKKGQYYLTGSHRFELMKNVTESLAGRAGILELLGLSLREIRGDNWSVPFLPTLDYLLQRKSSKKELPISSIWEIIHRGSLPELIVNKSYNWRNFYADYVKTYIQRDVRHLTQVANESDFLKFMTICASMTGSLINLASVSRTVGISEPTAKRWLSILQTSGIVYLLRPFSNNQIKRFVKTPKLYFLDTGLAAYLTRWLTPETLAEGAMSGNFFESFVFSELLKSYTNAGIEEDFYFLRDSNGKEIDLIIYQDNTIYPLEIKQHSSPTNKSINSFSLLDSLKDVNIGEGGVICLANDVLPLRDNFKIIPLWAV